MVGNWRERKESGVDTKEGAIKVSVLKAVLFLWRGLKPPVDAVLRNISTVYHQKDFTRTEMYTTMFDANLHIA